MASKSRQNDDVQAHAQAVAETLAAFERLGIPVFPSRYGRKGSYVEHWPELPLDDALHTTREAAAKSRINLAGRTGHGVAVLDLDAASGLDSDRLYELLLPRLEPFLIAVVK